VAEAILRFVGRGIKCGITLEESARHLGQRCLSLSLRSRRDREVAIHGPDGAEPGTVKPRAGEVGASRAPEAS